MEERILTVLEKCRTKLTSFKYLASAKGWSNEVADCDMLQTEIEEILLENKEWCHDTSIKKCPITPSKESCRVKCSKWY